MEREGHTYTIPRPRVYPKLRYGRRLAKPREAATPWWLVQWKQKASDLPLRRAGEDNDKAAFSNTRSAHDLERYALSSTIRTSIDFQSENILCKAGR